MAKNRISPLTGKPVRKYTKRGTKAAKAEKAPKAARAASVVRGGNRSGAGRKSSEVHFSQLNAKVDTLAGLFALAAEKLGVDAKAIASLYTESKPEPVQVQPEIVTAQPVAVTGHVAPATEAPKKRGPGRPRKIHTAATPAAAAPAPVAPVAPPVQPAQPVFAPQAPGVPAPQSVAVAQPIPQPVIAAPIQGQPTWPLQQPQSVAPIQTAPVQQFIPAPQAPVTFSPPPPPPPVNPQFAVGVAPLNVQPIAPVQPSAPVTQAPANGTVDFEAQFQNMQNQNQPK